MFSCQLHMLCGPAGLCRRRPSTPSLLPRPPLDCSQPELLAGRAEPLQVWDLCTADSVAAALRWRRGMRARWCAAGGHGAIAPADVDALLAAAANCSSAGRQSPLHAAADASDADTLRSLLRLGALVDARDRSGATALFAACEAGHPRSVHVLLAAGASATLRNSAGEAPLVSLASTALKRCRRGRRRLQLAAVHPPLALRRNAPRTSAVHCRPQRL